MLFGTILAVLALNPPFCDHAVVQREKTLTVWGEGAVAGERLQLDFAGARTWTKANADGTFRFLVPPQKAGGPFEMKVSGEKSGEASARDVLVGEVWLCSGQSNMAFLMRDAKPGWDDRPDDAQLRCFTVTNRYGCGVSASAEGGWLTATREDVKRFSEEFPTIRKVMLGRGVVANPALIRQCQGGPPLSRDELRSFHDALVKEYRKVLSGDRPLLFKMKEIWFYVICVFEGADKPYKALRKAQRWSDYENAVNSIFSHCKFDPLGSYRSIP